MARATGHLELDVTAWQNGIQLAVQSLAPFSKGIAAMQASMKSAEQSLQKMSKSQDSVARSSAKSAAILSMASKAVSGLVVAAAGYVTVQKLSAAFTNAATSAAKLFESSRAVGQTAGDYAILQRALEIAGMSAGEAQGRIASFAAEGRDFAQLFKSPKDFSDALGMAAESLGSHASDLNQSAQQFRRVQAALQETGFKIQDLFTKVGSSLLTQIQSASRLMTGLFKNGDIGKVIGLSILVGFHDAMGGLIRMIQSVAISFTNALITGVKAAMNLIFNGVSLLINSVKLVAQMAQDMADRLGKGFAEIAKGIANPISNPLGIANGVSILSRPSESDPNFNARAETETKIFSLLNKFTETMANSAKSVAMGALNGSLALGGAGDANALRADLAKAIKDALATTQPSANKRDNAPLPQLKPLTKFFEPIVDSLTAVGGGGSSRNLNAPMLEESRRQTQLQEQIAAGIKALSSIIPSPALLR